MPPPDRMLNTIRRAIDQIRSTPGRVGSLVHLQECDEVLVAGDLHGHLPNFQTVMKAADLANYPRRHLVLQEVVHGKFRYSNNGDKSHQLLDLFAALACQYPHRVHLLPGNHELAQWTNRTVGKADESLNELFRKGVEAAYGPAMPDIYRAYMELLKALPLALRALNGVFISHSLIPGRQLGNFQLHRLTAEHFDEKEYLPGGLVYGLLWGRDASEPTVSEFLRKVDCDWLICGHIPTDEGYARPAPQMVIVDCSASPAAYILLPTDRALTAADIEQGIHVF